MLQYSLKEFYNSLDSLNRKHQKENIIVLAPSFISEYINPNKMFTECTELLKLTSNYFQRVSFNVIYWIIITFSFPYKSAVTNVEKVTEKVFLLIYIERFEQRNNSFPTLWAGSTCIIFFYQCNTQIPDGFTTYGLHL